MKPVLTIVGGSYFEQCLDSDYFKLFGSGLRAAAALSDRNLAEINFISCAGEEEQENILSFACTFGFTAHLHRIPETVTFQYEHSLATPEIFSQTLKDKPISLGQLQAENVLYYGMIEAKVSIKASFLVYDPQNQVPLKDSGASSEHLALILNRKEALLLSGLPSETGLPEVGQSLLKSEHAEVVVIKNGAHGALVVEHSQVQEIPVYDTSRVWPIGSGDIFSAVFAWEWMINKTSARQAADLASQFTAHYCQYSLLPLPEVPDPFAALSKPGKEKLIYLAGPYYTIAERWLIHELNVILPEFGNKVFSPFHEVGIIGANNSLEEARSITQKDLDAIESCDVLLAIVSGTDPGTLFEIGYAKALNKKVVVLAENIRANDLTMLIGSGCIIAYDLSTAVYKASW